MNRKATANLLLVLLPPAHWALAAGAPPRLPALMAAQVRAERARAQANRRERAEAAALRREIVYSRPLPGATETLQIPVTGKAVDRVGRTFTFSGSVTLSIDTPSPSPAPVGTKLTGIRDPATALLVTTATAGQRLVLEGEGLLAATLLVTVGGERAAVLRQSAGMIEFTVPPVPPGKSPVLILYWLLENQWQAKGTLPLAVKPGPTPPPPPPGPKLGIRVDGFEDGAGRSVEVVPIHDTLIIVGSGFGTVPGRALVNKELSSVVSWSDVRIVCRSGEGANRYHRLGIDLWTPAGGWVSGIVGPYVVNAGETPLPWPPAP